MPVAFADTRVVDLSSRLSAAWCARLFGDFGAEVILVEPPEGHPLRGEPPFSKDGESLLHAYANSNKKSVLQAETNLVELVRSADVVVTSTIDVPECIDALGADAIHISVTPHGLTGPLAGVQGNNLTACARVGWSAINTCEGEPPLQLPHNQTGYIAGVAAFVGGAAALFRSHRHGCGEQVDVSEIEALSNTCAPWAQLGNFIGGDRMARGPNGRRTRDRPGPLWQTQDGAINFGYGDWAQWQSAFHFLGLAEIAENPDFIPTFGRHQKDTRPVRDGLAESVSKRDKWDVFHGLAERRCISGVVQNAEELANSEHLNSRGFIVETTVNGSRHGTAGAFAHISATPLRYELPAPRLGQHNRSIKSRDRVARPGHVSRKLPLDGIRVLTFTQAWSGTFATQLLALLGADVVQVEARKRPDVWRGAGAPVPPAIRNPDIDQNPLNNNGMYNTVNHNKRAITLDLKQPEGMQIFWDLVPKFDVLCDNFSPHVMAQWGVTLESLREKRKDIIFASLSGYGASGPLAEYPANGATTEPMAGLASIHGYVGDTAQNTGGLIPDPISGFYFAGAILAALYHRAKTGEGQRIDLSMIEAVAVQLGDAILEYNATGQIRAPQGNHHPRVAPHGTYRTKDDKWLSLAADDDEAFDQLARVIGVNDQRFTDAPGRKAHEQDLDTIIQSWASERILADALAALEQTRVIHAAVLDFQPIYAAPFAQFLERGFLAPVTHPESGTHFMPANPFVLTRTPRGPITHSPCFGQHSQEVLAEDLGITSAEYDRLERAGITGTTRL